MKHKNFIGNFGTVSFFIFCASIFTQIAGAAERSRCYQIPIKDSPMAEAHAEPRSEAWCYQQLSDSKGTYIYNADAETVRAELALVVDAEGMITHGSLVADEITYHKVQASEFNPFSIPLKEPKHLSELPSDFASALDASADQVLKDLQTAPVSSVSTKETFRVSEGIHSFATAYQPWRGYWWPYSGFPMGTPLGKYDSFVRNRTGSSPGARSWESSRHVYKGIWWEGHCNGWAASAIIRSEPRSTHSGSGVSFSVADIKGLLAEKDYCVSVAFFGNRYNGSGNIWDINPALFHRTITYYIGSLRKPVAMDHRRDSPVDNHVISGYSMSLRRLSYNTFEVTANLTVHKYDGFRTNTPGTAPSYGRTYRYRLTVDSSGTPISGTWLTTNPDFLWVPLAPSTCGGNNPRVSGSWVDLIRRM